MAVTFDIGRLMNVPLRCKVWCSGIPRCTDRMICSKTRSQWRLRRSKMIRWECLT